MLRRGLFLLLFWLCLAVPAWAGVTVSSQLPLYDYCSSIYLQDDFLSGTVGNGTIGQLGWLSAGGSSSLIQSAASYPGIFRKDTSASSGTYSYLALENVNASEAIPAGSHDTIWLIYATSNDANTQLRIGHQNTNTGDPPDNGTYFEKLAADTNWFVVTRASGVQTRTDTGVAVGTGRVTLRIVRQGSSVVQFYINRVLVASHTTNIPSTSLNPVASILNSAAASKTLDLDYFQLILTGLSRC